MKLLSCDFPLKLFNC